MLARLNYTSYVLTAENKYSCYNVSSINVLFYLTIPSTAVFKFENNEAQFSCTASENCSANKIKKTTLNYNFNTAQIIDISLRQFFIG
jgi:hypothetical protein